MLMHIRHRLLFWYARLVLKEAPAVLHISLCRASPAVNPQPRDSISGVQLRLYVPALTKMHGNCPISLPLLKNLSEPHLSGCFWDFHEHCFPGSPLRVCIIYENNYVKDKRLLWFTPVVVLFFMPYVAAITCPTQGHLWMSNSLCDSRRVRSDPVVSQL